MINEYLNKRNIVILAALIIFVVVLFFIFRSGGNGNQPKGSTIVNNEVAKLISTRIYKGAPSEQDKVETTKFTPTDTKHIEVESLVDDAKKVSVRLFSQAADGKEVQLQRINNVSLNGKTTRTFPLAKNLKAGEYKLQILIDDTVATETTLTVSE